MDRTERAGVWAGWLSAQLTGTLSLLRRARMFHPDGAVYRARVEAVPGPFSVKEANAPFQEFVYSLHSERLSRQAPTAACAGADFTPIVEDFLVFYTTETRASDGQVVNFSVRRVGSIVACFGLTPKPDVLNFYAPSIDIKGISATGSGECNYVYFNTPAQGSSYLRCFLRLNVPGFSGGFFATNTATGTEIVQSDVSQYGTHEASFAIIRLWRPNQ